MICSRYVETSISAMIVSSRRTLAAVSVRMIVFVGA